MGGERDLLLLNKVCDGQGKERLWRASGCFDILGEWVRDTEKGDVVKVISWADICISEWKWAWFL